MISNAVPSKNLSQTKKTQVSNLSPLATPFVPFDVDYKEPVLAPPPGFPARHDDCTSSPPPSLVYLAQQGLTLDIPFNYSIEAASRYYQHMAYKLFQRWCLGHHMMNYRSRHPPSSQASQVSPPSRALQTSQLSPQLQPPLRPLPSQTSQLSPRSKTLLLPSLSQASQLSPPSRGSPFSQALQFSPPSRTLSKMSPSEIQQRYQRSPHKGHARHTFTGHTHTSLLSPAPSPLYPWKPLNSPGRQFRCHDYLLPLPSTLHKYSLPLSQKTRTSHKAHPHTLQEGTMFQEASPQKSHPLSMGEVVKIVEPTHSATDSAVFPEDESQSPLYSEPVVCKDSHHHSELVSYMEPLVLHSKEQAFSTKSQPCSEPIVYKKPVSYRIKPVPRYEPPWMNTLYYSTQCTSRGQPRYNTPSVYQSLVPPLPPYP